MQDENTMPTSSPALADGETIVVARLGDAEDYIPEGPYECKIVSAQYKTSKTSGTPMLNLKYTVDEAGCKYNDRSFFGIAMLEGKGTTFTRRLNKAIGLSAPHQDVSVKLDGEGQALDYVGKRLIVVLGVETDESDEKVNKIKGYKAIGQ